MSKLRSSIVIWPVTPASELTATPNMNRPVRVSSTKMSSGVGVPASSSGVGSIFDGGCNQGCVCGVISGASPGGKPPPGGGGSGGWNVVVVAGTPPETGIGPREYCSAPGVGLAGDSRRSAGRRAGRRSAG